MILPPDVARHLRLAAIHYSQRRRARERWIAPDGWDAALDLLAVAERADQPDRDPEWLTLDQACRRAHVSERTLYTMRRNGLPSSRVGGRVRIRRDDLDHYLTGHRQPSADVPATGSNRAA